MNLLSIFFANMYKQKSIVPLIFNRHSCQSKFYFIYGFLSFLISCLQKMQVESGLNKWNGRVPPLDLSNVSVCPRETEQRWHKIQPNSRQMSHEVKRTSDGLPIGE